MTTRIRSTCAAACALATVLALAAGTVFPGTAFAAVSAVYTAATNPTYENPVTGAIEDSAGGSNVALAESMVTSIVYENALIERDVDGTMYASLRFKLADQISSIGLEASADGSTYEAVEAVQMQTGTDGVTSTATADYRFAIPSETSTIRCSMDVIPMGRAVVYFISFGALQEGALDDTFLQTVTPGEGTEDAAPVAASSAGNASGGEGSTDEGPGPNADGLASASPNAGVQEFDEEGREVTGDKQAEGSLDGGSVAMIAAIAAGVAVIAGAVVYATYVRPKRARQASAAAAAAAAASTPAGSGAKKAFGADMASAAKKAPASGEVSAASKALDGDGGASRA
ncbi:heme-binding Shp domain-containing protein [Gordonibacter massiliensis (ex Traore et al. 2017)]|uniref:Cell surface protein Shp haem-binding domain-containing protein n=1 Tax=Gordonibacter massiliensis (ex Traore et al. 2017) TaxID=1841863 RepID=A0A842J9D3_9ACTN|nr:heme-binding Shp domain-containing protein [Gordonibacter massiliensis (ex Traore et al. 2017)]MBC2888347.1 hypothetical protein [Gordonibacter massiliensis (ex Traore et al. 2017)]